MYIFASWSLFSFDILWGITLVKHHRDFDEGRTSWESLGLWKRKSQKVEVNPDRKWGCWVKTQKTIPLHGLREMRNSRSRMLIFIIRKHVRNISGYCSQFPTRIFFLIWMALSFTNWRLGNTDHLAKTAVSALRKGPPLLPQPEAVLEAVGKDAHCSIGLKIFLLSSSFLLNIKYVSFALIILVPRLCLLCRRKHNKTIIQSYEGGHLFSDVFRSLVNTDIKGRRRGNREGANDSLCFEPHGWWLTACPETRMQEKWVGFLQGSDLWPHLPGRRKTPSWSSFCWSELRKLPSVHLVHEGPSPRSPGKKFLTHSEGLHFQHQLGPLPESWNWHYESAGWPLPFPWLLSIHDLSGDKNMVQEHHRKRLVCQFHSARSSAVLSCGCVPRL